MATRPLDRSLPLEPNQLQAVAFDLRRKLQAHDLSDPFIERHADDALQQALAEYAGACERGQEIVNPGGWVVQVAYRRAIDQLRRERREPRPGAATASASTNGASLPTDEEAIQHVEAEQLHRAISKLSVAQRQALSLYFFEGKTTRGGADALGWSEPTFRRRRDSALQTLRERFGVEPDDRTAIEIGLAAWLSLAGAGGPAHRLPDQLIVAADTLRGGATALVDRIRELAVRFSPSGGSEGIAAAASGPFAKTAGACATAVAAACAATGVIGPGVGGVDLLHRTESKPPVRERAAAAPLVGPDRSTPSPNSDRPTETAPPRKERTSREEASASTSDAQTQRAQRRATEQFGVESQAGAPTSAPEPAPPPTTSNASPAPSPTQSAEEQFGLP